jgi:hypothetical protein
VCVQVSYKIILLKGSGYLSGNRRLHFYFFSTNTWIKGSAPVDNMDEYRHTVSELNNPELSQDARANLETSLLGLLNVYDVATDEKDAFGE